MAQASESFITPSRSNSPCVKSVHEEVDEENVGQHALSCSSIAVEFARAMIQSRLSARATDRATAGIDLVWRLSLHAP